MAKEYTDAELTPVRLDTRTADKLTDDSRLILTTFPASPAHQLGIGRGWRLLRVTGAPPTDSVIRQAEFGASNKYLFVDASGEQAYTLHAAQWPFGMLSAPWPGRDLSRRVALGECDYEDLLKYWSMGILSPYAQLAKPIEQYLSRDLLTSWEQWLGRIARPEKIALHDEYLALALLALCKAVAGTVEEAQFYLEAARDSRERAQQASYSRTDRSMDCYVDSLIAERCGDEKRALECAQAAKEFSPGSWGVEQRLARLQNRSPQLATPPWTLQPFPLDYTLSAFDPAGEIEHDIKTANFKTAAERLAAGQLLVVLVLGGCRSNYYYNLDLERLAILNRAFPGIIRAVHVIVAGESALDAEHRWHSEGMAKQLGLPFTILWDEKNHVAEGLEPHDTPARFLIDRNGTILATEPLADEEGFWMAIARMQGERVAERLAT